ncbi:MAG: glycosyltransferase family 39 protein [Lachnospiraceae bacterium]|nr:glycosyltransferase family 39 protein [Lachnospiraceae bacterium]
MHTKKDAGFLITLVLSMLILAYISFITVYEQILSQNNGFFNVIIYGVVLILVFIFITLFLRVINIKNETKEKSPVLNILVSIGIISIFAFFIYIIPRYTSSISPLESPLYKTATYINDGLLMQAMDIHEDILGNPANFVYAYIISLVFNIAGAESVVYIFINTVIMVLLAFFVYRTVKLISNIACAAFALIVLLLIPNNIFLVYSYNSEIFVAMLFMATLYLCELLIYKKFKSDSTARIIAIFAGIVGGLLISSEPVTLISLVALCIWIYKGGRQKTHCIVITLAVSLIEFIGIAFAKAFMMGIGFAKVIIAELLCFVPTHFRVASEEEFSIINMFKALTDRLNNPSKFLDDNSYFLTTDTGKSISASQTLALSIVDQFIILSMLILCVLLVVYIVRVNYDKIMPVLTLIITLFLGQILGGCNQVLYVYFICIFIVAGSTTLYYMFLNHHPEYAVFITNNEIRAEIEAINDTNDLEKADEETASDDLLRARALVFIGEDDALYNQIKEEERRNRSENSIAATRIKTIINEEGEYDSVEEDVEFLDSPDEVFEAKEIHEVKAIPATRPVEVVKPVLADDYYEPASSVSFDTNTKVDEEFFDEPDDISNKNNVNEQPTSSAPKSAESIQSEAQPQVEGFVFRKKNDNAGNNVPVKEKAIKEKKSKEKPVKEKNIKEKTS